MGCYIECPRPVEKAMQLLKEGATTVFPAPKSLAELPEGKVLICVVENGFFDAAAVIYSDGELRAFSSPSDMRLRTWLKMDREKVLQLQPAAIHVLK